MACLPCAMAALAEDETARSWLGRYWPFLVLGGTLALAGWMWASKRRKR